VGSTMAKAALADAESGEILWLGTRSNAGDTIEIIKQLLREVAAMGCTRPQVRGIGITGSARYQVQRALEHIYPELAGRVVVLVENYAHARGSIALARERVQHLKAIGEPAVNEDFCILVDIGGEDTKVSTIALKQAELFGNVMNLKCSAGTGSLMDTLVSMFGLTDVASACAQAFAARRAVAINATCAVFLMENARKLQLQGVPRDEILASANWAIVENMARTLWNQIELPANAVVLLHGQTMLSEPLPIAVTHRLQSCGVASSYALVPPNPGHRACFGLLATLRQVVPSSSVDVDLARFFDARFDRRIVQCRGAVCDDKAACCNRSRLTCSDAEGRKIVSFMVGGCSAVNELIAKKEDKSAAPPVRDTYKELWDFIDGHHPRSERADRLIIPRSFAVSEWAFLFARVFERLGIPVFVDNVRESDLAAAQPLFHIDTCAPHIGAVGQFRRLAGEPHGLILAMQIEFLPTGGSSAGRTCTLNQGGVGVALNLARLAHPEARFQLVNVDLSVLEAEALRVQLQERLAPVFLRYGVAADTDAVRNALSGAIEDHLRLRAEVADLAAEMAEEALAQGGRVAVVVGREYLLNPGIYDSHVRRLLRDKRMTVLPSFALEVELNPDYAHVYWRNPHAIVSLIDAVSRRQLHLKLRHARLREVFRTIEEGRDLLPLVQVSTFSCGPDSVVQPFIAEIMRQRPFLLIQSDAVIKELAHLENRVNTYIRQLELGLHERLKACGADRFEILALTDLLNKQRVERSTDVIYFPTLGDNRVLTATLRGAGYTCIDNYEEREYDLGRLVRAGRGTVGDAACAPLAAVYADLERAIEDFERRVRAGDPLVAGKRRLLYFDNKGPGPCRQGQYFDAHRLLFHRSGRQGRRTADDARGGSGGLDSPVVQFLVGIETAGYDIGIEEWVLARAHQGAVLHGVLQSLLFSGGASCRDYAEYEALMTDFRALKAELYRAQEAFHGPGEATAAVLNRLGKVTYLGPLLKYMAYGLSGRDLVKPLRRFADKWIRDRAPQGECIRIALTGEVYMRAAQGEEIFRLLLANLGFRRFQLEYTPVWNYLDYGLEEAQEIARDQTDRLMAEAGSAKRTRAIARARASSRRAGTLKFILRELVARPLYTAARLPMPMAAGSAMTVTRELLPTLRPLSESATYVGEAIGELRHGADLVLNVAPNGCMVATMGEALTPAIAHAAGDQRGRVQHLFSADGDVDQELLTLALLKVMGPDHYYGAERFVRRERPPEAIEPTRLLASAACPP
jgi:activator of 2-hydroxyglutaryl-CoA dehydratase/predicted nucleotide-binding protein (sugar kinase/HSP70/actin superfamily)